MRIPGPVGPSGRNEQGTEGQVNGLRQQIRALTPAAERWLVQEFGTLERFVHGFAYHNRDHGRDVASAAGRIASELHAARRVSWETVVLAPYAGWRHDAAQGTEHEERSAGIATQSLRGGRVAEPHIARVVKMIRGTKVVGVDGFRLVQAASAEDPEEALMADGDLSALGQRKGVYLALKLNSEQQHLQGLIHMPSPGVQAVVEPDRDTTVKFMEFHCGLYGSHRYLLDVSRKLFVHLEANRDEMGRLLELYKGDRLSYAQVVREARRYAAG